MTRDLTAGIVRILRPDGTTSGTGFLVSGDGLIATCSHVVQPEEEQDRGEPQPEEVSVVFKATGDEGLAKIEEWRPHYAEDVAILRLEGSPPLGAEPLPLCPSAGTSKHTFRTFGFPEKNPKDGIWGDGHILDKTRIRGADVLQITSAEVTLGFSGAPALDDATHRVVGMVIAIQVPDRYRKPVMTAFITTTETLREICPALMISDRPPYLGLHAFTEKDSELFFGRRRVVDRLAESLRQEHRFLAVLGPSGSGKSSVVQAGLIPSLRNGAIPGSDRWEFIVARPADRPFERLEEKGLEGASSGFVKALRTWRDQHPSNERLMLVLDQFEELLVTCPKETRRSFLEELGEVLDSNEPVSITLVMRDDFFGRFAQEAPPSLFGWVERGFVHVSSSLEKDELREIIEEPARLLGLDFEEGLAGLIVDDVLRVAPATGRSTVLPLLEFALTQLWERREEGLLTHHAYSAIGGVTGGLARWADHAYAYLDEKMQPLARRVLTDLVHLGDEGQGLPDSRRRSSLNDLCYRQHEQDLLHLIVQQLANARIVTTSMDNGQVTVEIIHDSLIRDWGRLQSWLKSDRIFLNGIRELEKEAKAWKNSSPRDEGRLLRGLRLEEAEHWLNERKNDLNGTVVEFLHASLILMEKERNTEEKIRADKERTRRRIVLALTAFSILTLVIAGFAYMQWQQSEEQRQIALARQIAAQSELIRGDGAESLVSSILLAVESLRRYPTFEGDLALRHGLTLLPSHIGRINNTGYVKDISFSLDGKRLAILDRDGFARIFDANTRREILRINQINSAISFSRNGEYLVTLSSDGTLRLWDIATGKVIDRMDGHRQIQSASFSLNGSKLIEVDLNNTARILDVHDGHEIAELNLSGGNFHISASLDNINVIYNGWHYDNWLGVWDINTGNMVVKRSLPDGVSASVYASSPNGKRLAFAFYDNTARILDITTGLEISKVFHESQQGYLYSSAVPWHIENIEFSFDSRHIVTMSSDGTTRVFDVETGQEIFRILKRCTAASFSPDGKILATATGYFNGSIDFWDATTGHMITCVINDKYLQKAAISPNTKLLVTAGLDSVGPGGQSGTARIWSTDTGNMLAETVYNHDVYDIKFSSDGKYLAFAAYHKCIMNSSTGECIVKIPHWGFIDKIFFNHDGSYLAGISSHDKNAYIWSTSTGQEVACFHHNSGVTDLAFSNDGKYVATSCLDNMTRIWDIAKDKIAVFIAHNNKGIADDPFHTKRFVSFSPDGTLILTFNNMEDFMQIYDVTTGSEVARVKHNSQINAATFSPDGKFIATTSLDNTTRLWGITSGKELMRVYLKGRGESVIFSPNGKYIACSISDNTARVWDSHTGQEAAKMLFNGPVIALAFSPDGKLLAAASADRTARVWLWKKEDIITQACSRIDRNLNQDEWSRYFGNEPYCKTCPNLA